MSTAIRFLTAFLLMTGVSMFSAFAQDRVNIRFDPGATSTTINGTIRGNEYIDYIIGARGGQTMVVSLAVTGTNGNGSAFFNILPAGKDFGGPYIGSTDDDRRAEVTVPYTGDWAIRVYLMGNDRDAGKTVGYSIDVYIAPGNSGSNSSGEPSVPGDGNISRVTGVPANDILNVRGGPGTGYRIVGALGNGDQVRRLGCQKQGSSRWCEIEMLTDMRERGWVNARYLSDSGGAAQLPTPPPNHPIGGTDTVQVRFSAGASGAVYSGTLAPGGSTRYVLNARDGQFLDVNVSSAAPVVSYQIFNPDNSFLLDQIDASQPYRGQLWQSGNHVIEVINRGGGAASYDVTFGIQ